MTKLTDREYALQSTIRGVNEWFDDTIANYQRMAAEIERYKRSFNEVDLRSKVDQLRWAINHANQANSNVRFDMAALRCAELAVVYATDPKVQP